MRWVSINKDNFTMNKQSSGMGYATPSRGVWLARLLLAATLGFASVQALAEAPEIKDDVVQTAIKSGKPTIAEFGADTCFTCKEMAKVLHQLEEDHGEKLAVAHVNIIKEEVYAEKYHIMLIPTQVFFDKAGQEIGRHMGPLTEQEILDSLGVDAAAGDKKGDTKEKS
jgi:thioredoxin 1